MDEGYTTAQEIYREDYETYLECAADEGYTEESVMSIEEYIEEMNYASQVMHEQNSDYYASLGV